MDQVATQVSALGYDVVRLPDFSDPQMTGRFSNSPEIYSYTNAIFSEDVALLPEMGVRPWDSYTRNIFIEMGYSPLLLPVAKKSICLQGGIRCLSETFRQPQR